MTVGKKYLTLKSVGTGEAYMRKLSPEQGMQYFQNLFNNKDIDEKTYLEMVEEFKDGKHLWMAMRADNGFPISSGEEQHMVELNLRGRIHRMTVKEAMERNIQIEDLNGMDGNMELYFVANNQNELAYVTDDQKLAIDKLWELPRQELRTLH